MKVMRVEAYADGKNILVPHGMGRMVMVGIIDAETEHTIFGEMIFQQNIASIKPGVFDLESGEYIPHIGPVVIYIIPME